MQMESVDHIKRGEIDSGETESDWFGYAYKSGDIIFYYNIKTGEHRWPTNSSCSDNIILQVRTSDVPDVPNELCSVATQTEDYDSVNQCTSMYVDNERQMENRENKSNEIKQEVSDDDTIEVNEQNTLNNPDVDNNLDEVSEDFEMDESLCTIITKMKRRKELVQSVHPQQSKVNIHNCPSCSRKFDQKSHLDVHVRVHTGEKPYECSYCNKAFALKSNLNVHLRTHTGEKPFECSVCGKAFAQKGALGDHLRIHTGEKPHECSLCHKAFRKKNHLKDHLRIHTSEKPYECSYCLKAFTQKSHLRVHLRIHTGNR